MKALLTMALVLMLALASLAGQDANKRSDQDNSEQKRLTHLVRYLTTSHTGTDEDLLKQLDHGCAQAMIQGNIETLNMIEADGFTFTGPDGSIMTKAQDLETIKSGDLIYQSISLADVAVRVYGDAGVVTGRANIKGKYKTYDISGAYRYTVTFVKLNGRWQAVASQMTRVQG